MKKILLRTLIIIFVFAMNPLSVLAQSITQQKNSIGLQVSPTQYNFALNIGESKTLDFILWQDTGSNLVITTELKTFSLVNNNLDFVINEEPNDLLTSWFKLKSNSINVKNEKLTQYSAEILVPENTPSGSYNVALVFAVENPNPNTPNGASINYRIVVPIIVTAVNKVLGVSESMLITKMEPLPFISFDGSIMIDTEITNEGSTHFIPRGVLQVENLWGMNYQISNTSFNSERKIVTSNTIRKFDTILNGLPLGRYKATLNTVYGLNNKVITSETYFYVIPWWLMSVVVIAFWLIIYRIWKIRSKKYKKLKL